MTRDTPLRAGGLALAAMLLVCTSAARAGEADVVAAQAYSLGDGVWRFEATLLHDDTGWDHYADRWDVVGPDGTVYGSRVLLHPHENEQPFTRSLGGVEIPAGIETVIIRAHDSVHELGGKEFEVHLNK